ncbi:MAG: hypothetical protein JRH07_14510 [Deltaproteobacteria bacterium]|nr:hypothetical protein [Deltaproteobacteria bacterium]
MRNNREVLKAYLWG